MAERARAVATQTGLASSSSSAIAAVGYDGYTLAVLFHTNDTVYTHPGVPRQVFEGLMAATSMGAYYNAYIRGRYQ